mgnify:CR=1 FL=1
MTTYMLKRIPDGVYVAEPGRAKSYTKDIRQARQFKTLQEADKERCTGNEVITTFEIETRKETP